MSLLDYLLITVVGLSMVLSLWRGFVREVISLIGLVAAFFVASRVSGQAGDFLGKWITNGTMADIAGFVLIYLLVMISVGIVGYFVCKLVDAADLTATDRTLGMIFGFARGGLLVALGFLIFTSYASANQAWLKTSVLAPYGIQAGAWLGKTIPEGYPFSRQGAGGKRFSMPSNIPAADRISQRDKQSLQSILQRQLQ
ncbi:MAG: CvpA family protein [Mariprofundales bacterium]|nr:CvpA family protein [Mariprofundales bacterium]